MRRLLVLPILFVPALHACGDRPPGDPATASRLGQATPRAEGLTPTEALGKAIFFDSLLSQRGNQSCASCHGPAFGFSGPDPAINAGGSVYMGSVVGRFGERRPPTVAYATQSPVLHFDEADEVWVGGMFWDGRATGERLGSPVAEQALEPLMNPVEQALPDEICALFRIAEGSYADLWVGAWGEDLRELDFPDGLGDACGGEGEIAYGVDLREAVLAAFDKVGLAVAAYQGSTEVNAFDSKFDAVLAGTAQLTEEEAWGLELFNGKGLCSACHISESEDGSPPLFTDYTYDNLGMPRNPLNPVYVRDPGFVDLGIGPVVGEADVNGAVKVPTLRNVARAPGQEVKAFSRNGVFKSLEQIVHFYNTRDVLPACAPGEVAPTVAALARMGVEPACWPPPEYPENVNQDEMGDLGLTPEEERAIVAFMRTLSDGWRGR